MPRTRKRHNCEHRNSYGQYCHTCALLKEGVLVDNDGSLGSVQNKDNDERKGRNT